MDSKIKKYSYRPHVLLLIVLAMLTGIIIWLYFGYGAGEKPYECTNAVMDSYMQQTVYGKNGSKAAAAAASDVSTLESLLSWRAENSDVAKLNANAGVDWVSIDSRTMELLSQCLEVAQRSGGAYDPTILPVASLWNFGGDSPRLPQPEEIQKFIQYVDYRNLRLDTADRTASLKNTMEALDLGSAANGAACDAAVDAYRQAGADYGVAAVGGSVGLYGTKKDGSAWKITVRDPVKALENQSSEGMGTVSLTSGFISTSAAYEKSFNEGGRLYHSVLDPRTGYPAENGLVSVTVTAPNGALSDILSAACFVLGRQKSLPLLDYYGAGGIFIDSDKNVYVTPSLQSSFTLSGDGYTLCGWD